MGNIIVHTLQITKPQQKLHFEIIMPENATMLTGIEISSNRYVVTYHSVKYPHFGIGVLRLFVADDGDCIFSEMLHADHNIPNWETLGEVIIPDPWKWTAPAPPFKTKQFTKATVINGFYEDRIGALILSNPDYKVNITLHYEI